jgi:hypothetical protein
LICAPLAVVALPVAIAMIASKSNSGNASVPASSLPQFGSLKMAGGNTLVPDGQINLYRYSIRHSNDSVYTAWLVVDLFQPTALGENSYVVQIGADCESGRADARLIETYSKKAGTGERIADKPQVPPTALESRRSPLYEVIHAICKATDESANKPPSSSTTDSARSEAPAQPR